MKVRIEFSYEYDVDVPEYDSPDTVVLQESKNVVRKIVSAIEENKPNVLLKMIVLEEVSDELPEA